ncbi:secreted salivary gland peptide-like protein [Dinothrombium tinctorium]|uniref:Secreted salivary gland peptide-like protein n=1 Tax=Dinothrombium tinctorium TaxID=1965070 RepID=A0A443R4Y8_9ACAR|nr:secreted salivary gland peptide-like protein [Dinothrombium tinctorium]
MVLSAVLKLQFIYITFDTWSKFLKYASCYRNISLDETKCASKYSSALSAPSSGETEDTDTVMKRSCCALREFVHCKLSHVGQDCGEKAEHFMEKHLSKITNPITERHCSAYTYGSEACRLIEAKNASSYLRNNLILLQILSLSILSLAKNSLFALPDYSV